MTRLRIFINTMMALTMLALVVAILLWQQTSISSEILFSVSLIFSFIGGIFIWININIAPSNAFRIFYAIGALALNVTTILMVVFSLSQGIPWMILGVITLGLVTVALALSYFWS